MITGSCWNVCEKCGEGYNAPLGHECKKIQEVFQNERLDRMLEREGYYTLYRAKERKKLRKKD